FSLLVPDGTTFAAIVAAVGELPDLDRLVPVEVFRGAKVPAGQYSLLLRAWWQPMERSLTDEQVNESAAALRARLQSGLGIRIRA
ncbi:MAG: hypothetical protein OXD30_07965, partial [Bryobacterales bacterium]|nr:hypothetical protein [Bryobacterales bacterium]